VEEQASSVLRGLANAIEWEAPEQLSLRNEDAEELRARVFIEEEKSRDGKDRWKQIEMRLCASLLGIASHLEWRARLNCALETGVEEAVGDWPIGKIVETGETSLPR
jgi:hypothetical protein